jgi:hypothetical protein
MDVDDLYALPLDRFIAERDALAKRVEDSDEGRRIKALRKPSLAAWAVNQASRAAPKDVRKLVALSDELRAARGPALRELARDRNAVVARLIDRARAILLEGGHSDSATNVERVTNTLQAASVDPGAVDDLLAGRIAADMTPSGFASLPLKPVEDEEAMDPAARRKAKAEQKRLAEAAAKAEREADESDRAADAAEERARALRRAARTARRRAEKARAAADAASKP